MQRVLLIVGPPKRVSWPMDVHTYAVCSRTEIDNLLAEASGEAKAYGDIEQWALRSIPDLQLRRYCLARAKERLADYSGWPDA